MPGVMLLIYVSVGSCWFRYSYGGHVRWIRFDTRVLLLALHVNGVASLVLMNKMKSRAISALLSPFGSRTQVPLSWIPYRV
jgi:hypothetical protein